MSDERTIRPTERPGRRPRIAVLVPYCPLPVDSGATVEMWKHLDVLRELGDVTILSARRRPVGRGWTAAQRAEIEARGFRVVLRDDTECRCPGQWLSLLYAGLCKVLRLEKAFGHANPYHRWAFPRGWWARHTADADLAVICYSYWARLPTTCPRALVLFDLWSDVMWGGTGRETRELAACDRVLVISTEEMERLASRGLDNLAWSPPVTNVPTSSGSGEAGIVGSANRFNVDGLRWLEEAAPGPELAIRVYGGLSGRVHTPGLVRMGRYEDPAQPYRDCGIILALTTGGMGVQIKTVEALAAGCAIIARHGAMRGLPRHNVPWVEVETAAEMLEDVRRLRRDDDARRELAAACRHYYEHYLHRDKVLAELRAAYRDLLTTGHTAGLARRRDAATNEERRTRNKERGS